MGCAYEKDQENRVDDMDGRLVVGVSAAHDSTAADGPAGRARPGADQNLEWANRIIGGPGSLLIFNCAQGPSFAINRKPIAGPR
jgi:hypothetical protein